MVTWVGTSWKMNMLLEESMTYAYALRSSLSVDTEKVRPFVIPPATALSGVSAALRGSGIRVGAQNVHWEENGEWTGEVSVPQVKDAGATIAEIGHAERRRYFCETDETVNLKVRASLSHGITPLVCVGEPVGVFDAGDSVPFVVDQFRKATAGVPQGSQVLIAYEPIWAIGATGMLPTLDHVSDVVSALRNEAPQIVEGILYGGSVSLDNASELMDIGGLDGLFVGRAALDVQNYIRIIEAVAH